MKKAVLFFTSLIVTTMIYSQKLQGKLVDSEDGSILIGASIKIKGTATGTTSDITGNFTLDVSNSGTLEISYVGYENMELPFSITGSETKKLGTIKLTSATLKEFVVYGGGVIDIVKDRQTPIAVSTIHAEEIKAKSGQGDFTELMKSSPSVYVSTEGGGFGDSRMTLRGFNQSNTAYLLNGQPINGMEDGKMYWSNWSGMTDVAQAIQIQRGLGSSKLAISSVGGTVNIVMKATESRKGGSVKQTFGNNGYSKSTLSYSTGMNSKGLAFTGLLTHWQGNGYFDGTKGLGQTYFFSLGYQPNKKHTFNLLITGAPQRHDQNYNKRLSSFVGNAGQDSRPSLDLVTFNNNWGNEKGEYRSERTNFYHKPVANLNWDFNINESTSLSTVLYGSWGRGGGTGGYNRVPSSIKYDENGQINWDAIKNYNDTSGQKPYLTRASVNNHSWYGLVTNLNKKLSKELQINGGFDARFYQGDHFRRIVNINSDATTYDNTTNFSGAYTIKASDLAEANPWAALKNTPLEERIAYSNQETISYQGVFGQMEYNKEKFSAFVQGALSNQSYQKFDNYYNDKDKEASEKVSRIGYNIKGGANYKMNKQNNVFVNAGYYSRQPFLDNVFLGFSTDVNKLTQNETVIGVEAGYGYRNSKFAVNINLYNTIWTDRTITQDYIPNSDSTAVFNNVGQTHRGVEIDFTYIPVRALELRGQISMGDWRYNSNPIAKVFNDDQQEVPGLSKTLYLEDVKVGNAAQLTWGASAKWHTPITNLSADVTYNHMNNLYHDFDASSSTFNDANNKGAAKLPDFWLMDFGVSYSLDFKKNTGMRFRANVNNVFNTLYINNASSNIHPDSDQTKNWNGVNMNNYIAWGMGRTWNISATYVF